MQGEQGILGERQQMILKAIVEAHIHSGEPIGSKVLVEQLPVSLSSATIRNEMADLEELGFLEKPHTSSGRVPSTKGYRYYVNTLMHPYALSPVERTQLDGVASKSLVGLDSLLHDASHTVSELTNYTALSIKPRNKRVLALSFKLLPMNDYGVLFVIQTSIGVVKTRFVEIGFKVSVEIADRLEQTLNRHLVGVAVEDVSAPLVAEMERELSVTAPLLIPLMRAFMEEIGTLNGGELRMEGVDRLLRYPEYANLEQLKGLLGLLEKKDYILNVVSGAQRDTVNVLIAPEGAEGHMQSSSIVFKTVMDKDRPVAAIGVLGPRRMDYSKVISAVDYVSGRVSEAIQIDTGALSEGGQRAEQD